MLHPVITSSASSAQEAGYEKFGVWSFGMLMLAYPQFPHSLELNRLNPPVSTQWPAGATPPSASTAAISVLKFRFSSCPSWIAGKSGRSFGCEPKRDLLTKWVSCPTSLPEAAWKASSLANNRSNGYLLWKLYHHFSELKTKKHWSWWSYTGLWFIEAVPPNCLLLKQRIAHSQFAQSHENSDPQKVMALGIEVRCKNICQLAHLFQHVSTI